MTPTPQLHGEVKPISTPLMPRPNTLPEPVDHSLDPLPPQAQLFLPQMPVTAPDQLWPHQPDFTTAPNVIDFLAEETEELRLRQSVELVGPADFGLSFPLNATPSKKSSTAVVLREIAETLVLTVVIFFMIQMFIKNFRVVGSSMDNNLHNGQYLIVDRISYSPVLRDYLEVTDIQRGDVIVFEPPNNPDDDYVKRVIGLPGETVRIDQGTIYINDEPLPEPYQPRVGSYSLNPVTVSAGRVFVLGDNRNHSNDSHNWGTVPIDNIVGRAWISYWPPELWGTIPRDIPTEQATIWSYIENIVPSANAAQDE